MKRLIFLIAFFLMTGSTFGQVLPKGTLLGIQELTITLKPGVNIEQYIQYLSNDYLTEWNKIDPDWQVYLVKGIRGNIFSNSYALINVLKSEDIRAKYMYDGGVTDLMKTAIEKVKPATDELNKLGKYVVVWTDWVVQ